MGNLLTDRAHKLQIIPQWLKKYFSGYSLWSCIHAVMLETHEVTESSLNLKNVFFLSVYPATMFFSSLVSFLYLFLLSPNSTWAFFSLAHQTTPLPDKSSSIKACSQAAISWHLQSRIWGTLQSHGQPCCPSGAGQISRRRSTGWAGLYPWPRAVKDWAAAIVEPCWITRHISEPQTAEEIALWSWEKKEKKCSISRVMVGKSQYAIDFFPPSSMWWQNWSFRVEVWNAQTQSGMCGLVEDSSDT